MQWETIFSIANGWPLPFWLLLAFGPRSETTARIIFYGGVAMLAATYALLFPLVLTGLIDAGGPALPAVSEMAQLSGIMAFFDSKAGAVGGWIHYLAFDLFVGLWIARNADRHGYQRFIQGVLLFFTLMLGPVGLFLYLLLRLTCKNIPENATAPS